MASQTTSLGQGSIANLHTQTSESNTQAAEHGQLRRRTIRPRYQTYLNEQRSVLINNIENQVMARGGWTERLYRAYSRLVFIERGKIMPSWEEYNEIQEQMNAEMDAAEEHQKEGDAQGDNAEVSATEDQGRNHEVGNEDEAEYESEHRDIELEDLQRLLASAQET